MGALTTKTKWRNPHHKKPASASTTTGTMTPIPILDELERPFAELFPTLTIWVLPLPLPLPLPFPFPFPFPLPLLLVAALEDVGVELELEAAEAAESL
jgi:hypothetical protein